MPKIGLRNIKTAFSVFICLLIYFLIILCSYLGYKDWSRSIKLASTIYTPFFACIATAYSVSTDKGKSLSQAKLRCLASLVGGTLGVIIIAIYIYVLKQDWPFSHISSIGIPAQGFEASDMNSQFMLSFIAPVILTGLGTILVIWVCNLIHHAELSFVAVLTFTAVMVSLGTNPIVYGPNRIFSTIVGVLVALGVNLFKLPHYRDKSKLFIISLDGFYTKETHKLSGYNEYKIRHLQNDGANITYFSNRTPEGMISLMGHMEPKLPVICMSGAALYDIEKKEYLYIENIDKKISSKFLSFLDKNKLNSFVSFVEDNVLYTYIKNITNEAEAAFFKKRKDSAYGCLIHGQIFDKPICYFMIIEKKDRINEIIEEIKKLDFYNELLLLEYTSEEIMDNNDFNEFIYLKIYSKRLDNLNVLSKLQSEYQLIGAGKHRYDDILLSKCKHKVTTLDGKEILKVPSIKVLNTMNTEKVFKELGKSYHSRNYEE